MNAGKERIASIIAAILVAAMPAGCSTLTPVSVEPFPMQWEIKDGALKFCKSRDDTGGVAGNVLHGTFGWGQQGDTEKCLDTASISSKASRNDLQHSLLGMATRLCREFRERLYKQTLSPLYLRTTGSLGKAAAVSLIPHQATADALGAASEVAGTVAGDVDGYFRETKLNIALAGVELARTRVFKQIIRSRREDLVDYPVGRAINDALRYHGVCTLADGLSEAGGAVEAATNPPDEAENPGNEGDGAGEDAQGDANTD